MLTTKQAAKLKGISVRGMNKLIARKKIKVTLCQCGQGHLIDENDLDIALLESSVKNRNKNNKTNDY